MDIFIVFDDEMNIAHLIQQLAQTSGRLYLFPLTSNFLFIEQLQKALSALPQISSYSLESAHLINQEVDIMQKNVHEWASHLGNCRIKKRTLKEWFLLPDGVGSAWWLGLLAEKNTVQDNVFFHIAQINALKKQLELKTYDECWIAIADKLKQKVILNLTCNLSIPPIKLKTTQKVRQSFKAICLVHLSQNAIAAFFLQLCIWVKESLQAHFYCREKKARLAKTKASKLLFVTYFPNIDGEAAKNGIFINHYAKALQEELKANQVEITWLAMPVFYHGHRFQSASQLAFRFIRHGLNLFLLQEFFTITVFCKTIAWWFRQTILSEYLLKRLPQAELLGNLTSGAALPYLKYLWRHSFTGTSGCRGIIFYLTYQQFFKSLPLAIQDCLYFCEMQAWEKALNLAKKKWQPQTRTYGFQHTVIMRHFYNYFYAPDDIKQQGKNTDLPLPNVLIANGQLPFQLFANYHYPNLKLAEAIRQLYLNQWKANLAKTSNKPLLLVVGSCDYQETKSLITLVHLAYLDAKMKNQNDFVVSFKGSPVNPFAPIFAALNIDIHTVGYQVYDQHELAPLLASAKVAIVANTTVAIEAYAYGCAVIIPCFADTMLMNPIIETKAQYEMVSNVDALNKLISAHFHNKADKPKQMNQAIINECWHLDPSLSLWKELLIHAKNPSTKTSPVL